MKTLLLCLLGTSLTASAAEYAVLSNGFRIHSESHSTDGALVTLNTAQGEIQIPASMIVSFENEEYTPPAPVVPAKPTIETQSELNPKELINRAAARAGLPPAIVHSVAKAESAYHLDAVSPKGALGLMQLMPETAASLNADPRVPEQNADAGALYLRQLLEKYYGDPHQVSKAVAAYNAGPAAVDKYDGVPPYPETIQYVNRVLREYDSEQKKKPGADD